MFFYPTLNDELIEAAGISLSAYEFGYSIEDKEIRLLGKGKSVVKFDDETWKAERDGLRIRRSIVIEYPEALFGRTGIVCEEAELGICIIWVNRTLRQMGTILPNNEYKSGASKVYEFDYTFAPGTIKGDLSLEMQLYIKKSAVNVLPDEKSLMNDEGVTVGILDEINLDFGNIYMEFPIAEVNNKKLPMWWLEMSDWSEPQKDLFDEDNLCIYLNTAYESCPKMGETIKNMDVLIDIITTSYVMLFKRVEECGCLSATVNDVNLEVGSISKMLYYFKGSCKNDIDFSSEERMHKSIWMNVAEMIRGGDDQ